MQIYIIFSRSTVNIGSDIPQRTIDAIYFSCKEAENKLEELKINKGHVNAYFLDEYETEDEPED